MKLINLIKQNLMVIIAMGSSILVTLIISLYFGLSFEKDGLSIEFILIFSILFITLPVVLIWSNIEFNKKN